MVRETPHGALFVTRGKLEHLAADGYLIPTDCWGNVQPGAAVPQDFARLRAEVDADNGRLAQGEALLVHDPRALMLVTDVAIQDETRDVTVLGQNLARALAAFTTH